MLIIANYSCECHHVWTNSIDLTTRISYLYFHLNQHRSDIIDSEHIDILEMRLGVLCDDGDDEHISVPGDGDGAHHSVCGGCGAHRSEQHSVPGDGGESHHNVLEAGVGWCCGAHHSALGVGGLHLSVLGGGGANLSALDGGGTYLSVPRGGGGLVEHITVSLWQVCGGAHRSVLGVEEHISVSLPYPVQEGSNAMPIKL